MTNLSSIDSVFVNQTYRLKFTKVINNILAVSLGVIFVAAFIPTLSTNLAIVKLVAISAGSSGILTGLITLIVLSKFKMHGYKSVLEMKDMPSASQIA